jgi:hypothetical protein
LKHRLYWLFKSQFGFDPRRLWRAMRGLPRYIRDYRQFRRQYSGPLETLPCLHDWYEEGGATRSEYFWQDLLVARMIFEARPRRHVDVGSRVDGFVAHVASFREIEVIDVRPITTQVPGMIFRQADLSQPLRGEVAYDSVSCLHALEHFGLGRYGDRVDARAHEGGLANLAVLLEPGGTLYLSVPIGRARVEFNANRVFDPGELVELARAFSLAPQSLTLIHGNGRVEPSDVSAAALAEIARRPYALGVFVFRKLAG